MAAGWASASALPTARYELATATSAEGRLYALGGLGVVGDRMNAALAAAEVYDPTTNAWKALPPMPTARGSRLAAAVGADGRVFAIGGYNNAGLVNGVNANKAFATVEAYSPSTNSWAPAASMPSGRYGHVAVSARDGRIYVAGGFDYPYPNGAPDFGAILRVDVYDVATNTWSTTAALKTSRGNASAVLGDDGRIFVVGGASGGVTLASAEAYDPTTKTWSSIAPMSRPRLRPALVVGLDKRIYAIGGGANAPDGSPDATVEAYSTATGTWTEVKATWPTPRRAAVGGRDRDGRIFVLGGTVGGAPVTSVDIFVP